MEQQKKRTAWVNNTLIILNILYFLYLETTGSSTDTLCMLKHGAMYAPYILDNREYYRLLTTIFMHFGIHHIANNMLILFVLGDTAEQALGSAKYLAFYLLCGIGANIISMAWDLHSFTQSVGAGASGAIFGVAGGLLYIVMINRGRLENLSAQRLIIMIMFSLFLGVTSPHVDNTAHMSGLILGIILAAVLYRKPKKSPDRKCKEM